MTATARQTATPAPVGVLSWITGGCHAMTATARHTYIGVAVVSCRDPDQATWPRWPEIDAAQRSEVMGLSIARLDDAWPTPPYPLWRWTREHAGRHPPMACGYGCGAMFWPDGDWVAAHVVDGDPDAGWLVSCRSCNERAKGTRRSVRADFVGD